jgi:membrane protein DedA with SNARE-associated domain
LASSAIGAGLNYWFVRAWGQRALVHFRQRHLAVRQREQAARVIDAERASLPVRE